MGFQSAEGMQGSVPVLWLAVLKARAGDLAKQAQHEVFQVFTLVGKESRF